MNMWIMYLVLKLDMITGAMAAISIGTTIISLFVFMVISSEGTKEQEKATWKVVKKILLCMIFPFLLFILLPTTKQAAMIYFVPKVLNNKQIQKMPNKLVTLANSWMDEQIKSIKTK